MVDAACNWMKAGLPLRCLKIVLFSENTNRIPGGTLELIDLFERLKSKWEKRGASLKVKSLVLYSRCKDIHFKGAFY